MRLTAFNGGLNVRVDPHLIQDNQGRVFNNIDDSKGTLTPVKDKVQAISDAKKYGVWFTAEQRWVFSDTQISWAEFQEKLYYADGSTRPKKVIDGTTYNLGITPPSSGLNLFVNDIISPVTTIDFIDATNYCYDDPEPGTPDVCTTYGYLPHGDYEYILLNVNANGKIQSKVFTHTFSAPDPQPRYTYYNAGWIRVSCDDAEFGDYVKVYRKYQGQYRLVDILTNPSDIVYDKELDISENEKLESQTDLLNGTYRYALTYYSSLDGTESAPYFSGEEVEVTNGSISVKNIPVPSDPQITQKYLYRLGGNLTEWTLVDKLPLSTTTYNDVKADTLVEGSLLTTQGYLPPKNSLRYLTEAYAMLFGAVGDKLYFTPIGLPNAWPESYYLDFPTTITGIAETQIGLLVCTENKTWLVTGTGPNSLAQQLLDGSEGCINHYTMQNLEGAIMWVSRNGICASNGGSVVVTTKTKMDRLVLNPINAVVYDKTYYVQQADGTLFAADADAQTLKTFELGTESLQVGDGKLYGYSNGYLHELFASSANLKQEWLSAEFAIGGLTQQKFYKNIYAYIDGPIELTVYINGKQVQQISYEDTDIVQLKVPTSSKGNRIQFGVKGTGRLLELYWEDNSANA